MAIFRVRNITLPSFLRFGSESEPLNLVDITSDSEGTNVAEFLSSPGSFIYETRFTVDEESAYRQGVSEIKFEFFTNRPADDAVPLKDNTFTFKVSEPTPQPTKRAAIYLKASGMEELAAVARPIQAISVKQPLATSTFKATAASSETVDRIDPANVLASGKVLGTTPGKILNFGIKNQPADTKSQNFDRVGARESGNAVSLFDKRSSLQSGRKSEQQSPIVNNFLNLGDIINPNSLVRTLPVVAVEVASRHIDCSRQLVFNKQDLLGFNKLYMRVSGTTKRGTLATVQKKIYTISHASEVGDFLGNAEPPVVQLSESTLGRVSFILRKADPTLRKVSVIRITKNPNQTNFSLNNIGTLNFDNRDVVFFSDEADNIYPNTVIYRFIVVNDDGSCGEFSSVVVPSYNKVADQKKSMTVTTPISIRAINEKLGVRINVDTLNDQVYSIRLLRQDFGLFGEFQDTVKTIRGSGDEYSTVISGQKRTLDFFDTDVVDGRHYRYFAAYRLGTAAEARLGQETISDEDETIVRVRPRDRLPFSADLTPAVSTQDSNNVITVEFDISVKEVEEQYNLLFDALQKAGVGQQFISDLQNDRQKTREVVAFLVERVDRESGKRCSFGMQAPGKFSDSPATRRSLGLPEPAPGRKYEYVCKMCIRPPTTFLLGATVGFTAFSDTSGNITNVIAAKFQNALIDRGILPSERQLRDGNSIRENFLLGQTGLEVLNEIRIPSYSPKVENVTVKPRHHYNLVSWNVTGDTSNVSYFLVYCNYNGNDELLGAVSSVGRGSSYQFKDTRFSSEVGVKGHFVRIVTLDHDVSIPSPKAETLTDFSIPPACLDGYILSPSRNEINDVVLPGPGPKINANASGAANSGIQKIDKQKITSDVLKNSILQNQQLVQAILPSTTVGTNTVEKVNPILVTPLLESNVSFTKEADTIKKMQSMFEPKNNSANKQSPFSVGKSQANPSSFQISPKGGM